MKVKKFADDTKLGQKISDDKDCEDLQRSLDGMMEWARTWAMQFNVQKCKVMHVAPETQDGHIQWEDRDWRLQRKKEILESRYRYQGQ
jgi:hypothetical protein